MLTMLHQLLGDDEPFVVEEPYEWPDETRIQFDAPDDEGVVYDFGPWEDAEPETVQFGYRDKVGPYTRVVWFHEPSDATGNSFDHEVYANEHLFDGDEQVLSRTHTIEYDDTDELIVQTTDWGGTTSGPAFQLQHRLFLP